MRGNMDKGSNHKDGCPQTMKKAEEIQKSLSPQHPSFIKIMKRSHVSNPFYTCPPTDFCRKHLPKSDEIIVFEVESGMTYEVKFLAMAPAFSGKWKGFAEAEKLLENDVLVFHLIEPGRYLPKIVPCKFKVYIVRANEFLPVDKAPTISEDDHHETTREVEKKRTCIGDKKEIVKEKPTAKEKSTVRERDAGDVTETCFRGVRKQKSGRYGAEMHIQGRNAWLGTFNTAEEAAHAYDAAAREHHGAKAVTNFPLDQSPRHSTTTVNSTSPSRKHHKDMENVCQKRASCSDLPVKLPTDSKDDDFKTEIEVEKKGTCERNTKRPRLVPPNSLHEKIKVNNSSVKAFIRPHSSNSSNLNGSQPSEFVSDFKNFKILVNDTAIELLPHQVRKDYFKLCCTRESYLHRHLSKSMDPELAASVISGTVNIANAIRESKISTPQDKLAYWNTALDGFEVFGMEVGFIRGRLTRLSGLALDLKKYRKAKIEFERVEEKIVELKKEKRRLQEEMREVDAKPEVRYEEEASAPW